MATLGDIKTAIKLNCKDSSITSTKINAAVNEGLKHVAKKILLPELESSGVVSTVVDDLSVIIPADWNFMRNFYACDIVDQDSPGIINSIEHLKRIYPEYDTDRESGEIEYIVPLFASIIYYPIPTEVTELKCKFYKLPTPLVKDTDVITGIPEGYQEPLLENYALAKIWKSIEDGMEATPKNAPYHRALFQAAFEELDEKIDTGQSRAEVVRINHFGI